MGETTVRSINLFVERYRIRTGKLASDQSWGNNGAFEVPRGAVRLRVIVSDQSGWDHVSVSLPDRSPVWEEMQYVRSLWFASDEWVVQFSPPESAHINCHPHCLHMWRKQTDDVTPWVDIPPAWMVAPVPAKSGGAA